MAIKRTFNGATIIKPGSYSKIVVENLSGFPLQSTGTVGIIGEARGGEPQVLDILNGPNIQTAKARYKSGPIADALGLLAEPSNDPKIANGASTVIVFKTNMSTQSELTLPNTDGVDILDLKSKNYGEDENLLNIDVSEGSIEDSEAEIIGTINGPFDLSGGGFLLIIEKDGVPSQYTSTLNGAAVTAQELADDINVQGNWTAGQNAVASVIDGTERIKLSYVDTSPALEYGTLQVDPASTLDTITGLAGYARGVKGSRIFTLVDDKNEEVSPDLGGLPELSLKYTGLQPCTLSIKKVAGVLRLQTTVAGASSDDLDLVLADSAGNVKFNIKSLVSVLNSKPNYEAAALNKEQLQADQLDYYEDIKVSEVPVELYANQSAITEYFEDLSDLAEGVFKEGALGQLAVTAIPQFFTGAVDGTSANSDFAKAFEAFKDERINVVVPLVSKDSGAVTVDSVNALASNHAKWAWSTTGKSERSVFGSKNGSKDEFTAAARALATPYFSLVGQQPRVLDSTGSLIWKDEWAYACLAAGMRAGAEVGEPLTFKLFNANDLRVEDGSWDPKKDYEEMIDAGCWIGEPLDKGGFRHVCGNTTYGLDANFVWNRESTIQASGFVAYDLRYNLELTFVGNKAKTGTAEAIANFIKARMSTYLDADIIVGDDLNEGLGYKNLSVRIEGGSALIDVSITPVQGIDFLLPTIYLSDIRQSA